MITPRHRQLRRGSHAVADQAALFGVVASDSTAFRVINQLAGTAGAIDRLRAARATARARVWEPAGAPEYVTSDLDATLLTAHSDKEGAEPRGSATTGFTRCSATAMRPARRSPASCIRATLAPAASHQISVAEQARARSRKAHIEDIKIVLKGRFGRYLPRLSD